MPECHGCPHDGKGSRACLKCAKADIRRWKKTGTPDTQHNDGKTHVSVDEVAGFIPAPEPTESDDASLDAAVYFIRALCGLGVIEREILFSRLVGMQYPAITKRLNLVLGRKMTIQAVHWHAKRGLMDPAFAKLFRAMLVKQDRRRGLLTTREKANSNLQNVYRLPRLLSERARLEADMEDAGKRDADSVERIRELDRQIDICRIFPEISADV